MMYLTLSEDSRPNEERNWLVDIIEVWGKFEETLDIWTTEDDGVSKGQAKSLVVTN